MINSVSSVSFKAAAPQYDALSRPGAYTNIPKEPKAGEKKDHKALKWIAGITVAAIAAGTLLAVGAKRNWFKKLPEGTESAKFLEKVSDKLHTAGMWVAEKAEAAWAGIKKLPETCKGWIEKLKNKPDAAANA